MFDYFIYNTCHGHDKKYSSFGKASFSGLGVPYPSTIGGEFCLPLSLSDSGLEKPCPHPSRGIGLRGDSTTGSGLSTSFCVDAKFESGVAGSPRRVGLFGVWGELSG